MKRRQQAAGAAPVAVVTALNDYNVVVELWAWLENERHHVLERARLRERVRAFSLDCSNGSMSFTARLPPDCDRLPTLRIARGHAAGAVPEGRQAHRTGGGDRRHVGAADRGHVAGHEAAAARQAV